jgi:hypothetical protein
MGRDARDRNRIFESDHPFRPEGGARKRDDGWKNHLSAQFRGAFAKVGISTFPIVKPIGETIVSAAAAVKNALARKAGPIAPQLVPLMEANSKKLAALEVEIAGLSLDELLDETGAAGRRKRLIEQRIEAVEERDRLQAAYETALSRDQAAENEVEIAAVEAELAAYEQYAAARLAAALDFDEAAKLSKAAAKKLLAANDLLKTALPRGCRLPNGLTPGGLQLASLTSTLTVREENDHLLASIREQVRVMTAVKRREQVEINEND